MRAPNPSPHSNEPIDPAALSGLATAGIAWAVRDCVATARSCVARRRTPVPVAAKK